MINSKWLELYRYMSSTVEHLPLASAVEVQLAEKMMFLSAQFLQGEQTPNKNQIDWLEHEAFTLVMSDVLQSLPIPLPQLNFLFETLMAAQLCQLTLGVLNCHQKTFSPEDFKTKSGLVYQQLGDYELAQNRFEEAMAIKPDEPMLQCHLGFNHIYTGNLELAIACFQTSIKVAPDFVGGYQNLAGVYYQEGEFALAADYAEQALKRDNSLPATYITAVSSYLALGEGDKAEQWVNAAFENQVTSMELVRLAGISAHRQGRPEEAIEALSYYLESHPSSFDVLSIRARAKAELKRYADLEGDLKQLLVFEPHDEWSLEQLFLCYFHTQQWSDAQVIMAELNKLAAHFKITYREQLNVIYKKLSLDVVELN